MNYCLSYEFDGSLIQNVYFPLFTVFSIISPILFVYTSFCIIYLSPKMMKTYRWFLLAHHISAELVCSFIHTYARPITFVPLPISAVTGVLRHVMPAHYLLPVGVILQIVNCATLIQLFAYRYWAVAKLLLPARKYHNFHKLIIFAVYAYGIALFVLLEYVDYKNPRATEQFIATYTCVKELTAFPIKLYGHDEDLVKTYFLIPLAVALVIILCIFAYFPITNYRVIDARNMSPQLNKLHRSYINQLICQALIPSFIVFLPVSYFIIAVYNEIQGHEFLVNLPILSLSMFSIIDSSVVIAMNKTYHTWFIRKFKEYGKFQTSTVLSLHRNPNQVHHQ